MRILLALKASQKLIMKQFDVKTAFLNGEMTEDVYTVQVKGFEDSKRPNHVWKLNKSLYGTRQGAKRWQQHLNTTLFRFHVFPIGADTAVYVMKDARGLLILHVHVDDSLVFSDNEDLLRSFRDHMNEAYTVKWNEEPALYLGIKIEVQEDSVSIGQSHYIDSILDRFGMTNRSIAKTPVPAKTVFKKNDTAHDDVANVPYQELIGSLQWLASSTRPDIAYAVSQLRFNACWSLEHWILAKHVLRYLQGTKDIKITYHHQPYTPEIFSDSDFSQCSDTRRSVSGYLLTMSGGPVSWMSRRQNVVALSTTEAEYMAASDAARHVSWLKTFLFDVYFQITTSIAFYIDNTSAIFNATNEAVKSRSKHVDRRFHYIRDMYERGEIKIHHIPTEEMLADFLTKPLGPKPLEHAMRLNNL